jgi:hypothetical protein
MTNLMTASSNLKNRPADEHYSSMANLLSAARRDAATFRAVDTDVANLEVATNDGDLMLVSKRASAGYRLTNHSLSALCQLVGARTQFITSLTPKVAAIAMSDALSRVGGSVKVHLGTFTGDSLQQGPVVARGLTSTGYSRFSDADLLGEADEWLVGSGFEAARPTKNTDSQRNNIMGNAKPALFRGDRDSFCFFMHEERSEGAGGRPIRRGVIIENSEVGASSVWIRSFIFDDLCANFIIWGAQQIQVYRGIHRGDRLQRDVRAHLRSLMPTVTAKELDILHAAAAKTFAPDADTAVERLIKEFELSEERAKVAVMLASANENRGVAPLSYAGIGNGVTSLAKSTTRASTLVEVAQIGGLIYEAAAK